MGLSLTLCYTESSASCQGRGCRKILDNKIPSYDKRYDTFALALDLMSHRKPKVIIETGTARDGLANCIGDGCSTMIFAEYVKNNGGEFYSVDINAEYLQNAGKALADSRPFATLVHSDSIAFLQNFNRPIDFLYLDSYDYDFSNPLPSQEHHLKEIKAAYPWLSPYCVVMIDDCDLPGGGKGKLAIDFLLSKGWGILGIGYQVVLIQK